MRKVFLGTVRRIALGMALLLAGNVHADKIGINFVGGSTVNGMPQALGSSEVAGFVPQQFWNNAAASSGTIAPEGDGGGGGFSVFYSGFHLTWSDVYGIRSTPIVESPGNARLMKGYLNTDNTSSGAATVTVTGVPPKLTANGYAVILYFDGDNKTFDRVSQFTLTAPVFGTRTLYGLDKANVDFGGTFKVVPGSSTTDQGGAPPDGNVVMFVGLNDDSFTLTVNGASASDGNSRGALNAIQLVNLLAMPPLPAVAITGPTNGSTATACLPLPLTAAASDTSATITTVEYFAGAAKIGQASASPYRVFWKPDAVGSFTLTAKATDSQGITAMSDPVQVTVVPPLQNQLIADGFDASGAFNLCLGGEAGKSYVIEASTNFSNWTVLGPAVGTNGLLQFRDATAPGVARRFYRALGQ
ncbi:MAG: Ig-like domain-containing protein [Limisphaerales bacterium]